LGHRFWPPFVKRFALCYRSVVCPVCLSVCAVSVLWLNSWIDQDETWHVGRPRPHCVRWGPSSPQRGTAPYFQPMSIVVKRSPISAILLRTCVSTVLL